MEKESKKGENWRRGYQEGRADLLSTLKEKVERMDKDETGDFEKDLENRGYNTAIKHFVALLSELEK